MTIRATLYILSKKEQEVLNWLYTSKTLEEIAEEMHLSLLTVKTHTHHIYSKMGIGRRIELLALRIKELEGQNAR